MFISERIKAVQRRFDLNNVELANLTGVTKQAVGRWINHNVMPTAEAIIAMREKLGVSEVWLVTGKGAMMVTLDQDDFAREMIAMSPQIPDGMKENLLRIARDFAKSNAAKD